MFAEARVVFLLAMAAACCPLLADDRINLEGSVGMELRLFDNPPALYGQRRHAVTFVVNPSVRTSVAGWQTKFSPYIRLGSDDSASRYVDVREASAHLQGSASLWRLGIETVHWSNVESNHLVNIVNQIDTRSDVDLTDKLGQPLVSFTRFLDSYGRVELIWLPFHRPRPLLGKGSRQRIGPVAHEPAPHGLAPLRRTDDAVIRWSGNIGDIDLGVYAFSGLSREPDQERSGAESYRRIRQLGLNAQLPTGSLLWKLEAIQRRGHGNTFSAYVFGGEYTLNLSSGEVGLLFESMKDHRDATAPPTRFADAIFSGVRYRFNESGDGELLYGVLRDKTSKAWLHKFEFSRRVSPEIRLSVVVRKVASGDASPYSSLRNDSNLQLTVTRHF